MFYLKIIFLSFYVTLSHTELPINVIKEIQSNILYYRISHEVYLEVDEIDHFLMRRPNFERYFFDKKTKKKLFRKKRKRLKK